MATRNHPSLKLIGASDTQRQNSTAEVPSVHLISLPWGTHPLSPSLRVGCFATALRKNASGIDVFAYHLSTSILFDLWGAHFFRFYWRYKRVGEYFSLAAFLLHARPEEVSFSAVAMLLDDAEKKAMSMEENYYVGGDDGSTPDAFGMDLAEKLAAMCIAHVDEQIIPNLTAHAENLLVFPTGDQADQMYLPLLVCYRLRERGLPYVALFTGEGAHSIRGLQLLRRWQPDALTMLGEEESTLVQAVTAFREEGAVRAGGATVEQLAGAIVDRVSDILPVGQCDEPRDSVPRSKDRSFAESFEDLPSPDYSEFFETLGAFCEDEGELKKIVADHVYFPVEGARGCPFRCDFCAINRQWPGLRARSDERTLATVDELQARWGKPRRFDFEDKFSDTWIEAFCDRVLARGGEGTVPSRLALRVAHPQSFWTKLALVGVEHVQIGVETLSPPLLKKMKKGASVLQVVRTHKILKELGIAAEAFLMTRHPRSEPQDIAETRRLIELIPHLDQFLLSEFRLIQGSPLFGTIADHERASLKIAHLLAASPSLEPLLMSQFIEPPASWRASEHTREWIQFAQWYRQFCQKKPSQLDILECSAERGLKVLDTRFGRRDEHAFGEEHARVYRVLHDGVRVEEVMTRLAMKEERVKTILGEFLESRLVVNLEGAHLSLALRSRDELIAQLRRRSRSLIHPAWH